MWDFDELEALSPTPSSPISRRAKSSPECPRLAQSTPEDGDGQPAGEGESARIAEDYTHINRQPCRPPEDGDAQPAGEGESARIAEDDTHVDSQPCAHLEDGDGQPAGEGESTRTLEYYTDVNRHLSQELVTILNEFDYAADDEANRVALQEAEAIANQLSTKELVNVISGKGLWSNHGVPRLGVPGLNMTDGPYGARGPHTDGPCAALTPCGVSLASTWDLHLVARIGMLLAEETKLKGSNILLGPCVNLTRIPIGGRTFECLGEDPCLAAQVAVAYIRGVQAMGVGACVKHFIVNDQEKNRKRSSVIVEDRALRRVHMVPFEAAVKEGRVMSVMTAYNKLNGRYCSEHKWLVTDVLRKEWGFKGLVVSDWTAAHHTVRCVDAGLDLDMPERRAMCYGEKLISEIKQRNVSVEKVKKRAIAVLQVMAKLGLKRGTRPAGNHFAGNLLPSPNSREQQELLHKAASEGTVLLKNEGNLLPLSDEMKLAVIGPHSSELTLQGGGSASVKMNACVNSLVEALKRKHLGELQVCMGCDTRTFLPPLQRPFLRAETGNGVLNGVFYAQPEQESNRRSSVKPVVRRVVESPANRCPPHPVHFDASKAINGQGIVNFGKDVQPVHKMDIPNLGETTFSGIFLGTPPPGFAVGDDWFAIFKGKLHPEESGDYEFCVYSSGKVKVFVDDKLLIEVPKSGQEPLMIVPEDYKEKVDNEVRKTIWLQGGTVHKFRVEWQCGIGFYPSQCYLGGRRKTWKDENTLISQAVHSAEECDAAVVVVGTDAWFENEGDDQPSFQLPGRSAQLIERVAKANSRTIVCLNVGSPKSLEPWLDKVAAVLVPWYGGQEGALSLADVILGRGPGPCGRLPITWPKLLTDGPTGNIPNERYPGIQNKVQYMEEDFIGYRWYEAKGIRPAFPFGHGLSYTDIRFIDAVLPKGSSFLPGQSVPVQVSVENIGQRAGMEVIQIYVLDLDAHCLEVDRSTLTLGKELAAFAKISLNVGEAYDVDIAIPARVFEAYSEMALRLSPQPSPVPSPKVLSPSPSTASLSSLTGEQDHQSPSFMTLPFCSVRRRKFTPEVGSVPASAMARNLVPVLVRHAVEHEVLHLRMTADATIKNLRETLLRGAGDVEPSKVQLARRLFGDLQSLDDSQPLEQVRSLVVKGMSFKDYHYGAVASEFGCRILEGDEEVETCPNCPTMVVVESSSRSASRMGIFSKTQIEASSQQEGRPIYVNAFGQYLYYWSEALDWRIGPSYLQDQPDLRATGSSAAENPLGASSWQVWDQGRWVSAGDVVVKAFKFQQELLVQGAEVTQAKRMGLFTRVDSLRRELHAFRPVYVNAHGQYLYYWATYAAWRIGPDYTKESSGITSSSSKVAGCPTLARAWQMWDGRSWRFQSRISVKDPSAPEEDDVLSDHRSEPEPASPSSQSTESAFTEIWSEDRSPHRSLSPFSVSPRRAQDAKTDLSPSPPRRELPGDRLRNFRNAITGRKPAFSPGRSQQKDCRGRRGLPRMRIGTTGFDRGGRPEVERGRGRPEESVPARRPSLSLLSGEPGDQAPQQDAVEEAPKLTKAKARVNRATRRFELHIGKSSADIIFKREIEISM